MWLKNNWEFIAIFFGGIGTFWTFISEKWRYKISKPFITQKQKIELNSDKIDLEKDNIDLQIKWKNWQNERVEYALKKYEDFKKKSDAQVLEMQEILDNRDEVIKNYKKQTKKDSDFLENHRIHIKYLENLLKKNNITHKNLKDE